MTQTVNSSTIPHSEATSSPTNVRPFRVFLLGIAALLALQATSLWTYRSAAPTVLGRYSTAYAAFLGLHGVFVAACLALAGPLRGLAETLSSAIQQTARSALRSRWALGLCVALLWALLLGASIAVRDGAFARSGVLHWIGLALVLWSSLWLVAAARTDIRARARSMARLMICLSVAGVALLAVETCLRKNPGLLPVDVIYALPENGDAFFSFYEFDDDDTTVGYRYKPGLRFSQELRASQAAKHPALRGLVRPVSLEDDVVLTRASFVSDAIGYRNAEPLLENYPVVVSGDSFTSYTVEPRPWPTILAEKTGKPILNLGLQGYGPPNEVEAVIRFGLPRKPVLVILGYYEGNDIIDSQQYEKRKASGIGWDDYAMASLPVIERQLTFHVAKHLIERTSGAPEADNDVSTEYAYPFSVELGGKTIELGFSPTTFSSLSLTKAHIEGLTGFKTLERSLERLRQETRAMGAKILVVYFPTKEHCYAPLLPRELLEKKLGGAKQPRVSKDGELLNSLTSPREITSEDLFAGIEGQREAVTALLGKLEIELLDLTPTFQEVAKSGVQLYWATDNHWAPPGHELAASTIAHAIHVAR